MMELSRAAQGQLQQTREQVARLGEQVQACNAHTKRVRPQIVALGRTADTPRAEATFRIQELSRLIEQMLGRHAEPTPPQPKRNGGARTTPPPRADSGSDSTILRANVHVTMTHQQAQDAIDDFRSGHTRVNPELTRVAGRLLADPLPLRVSGACNEAALRVEEILRELRDRTGQRREIDIHLAGGAKTRIFSGRDRSRAQMQVCRWRS